MIIVELALQAIKGFPAQLRLPLKPGLNVAKTSDRELRRALFDAIYHTLYPDPSRAGGTAHLCASKEARIALTLYGRDKATYRLLRDAETGATRLFRYDADKQKYALLSEASQEAAQYVRVQQQLPDEVSFERLFLYAQETFPSLGDRARTRSGAPLASGLAAMSPSGPGLPLRSSPPRASSLSARPRSASVAPRAASLPPRDSSFGGGLNVTNALVQSELAGSVDLPGASAGSDSAQDRLEVLLRLRQDLAGAQRAERAQAELDQINLRKFELNERAERVVKLRSEVERLEKESGPVAALSKVPPGFEEKLRQLEGLEAKYGAEQQRLFEDTAHLESELANQKVPALSADPYFVAGLGGAFGFVALAVAIEQPVIALGNILGVLVAVGAAFHWVSGLEARSRVEQKLAGLHDRRDRLDKQRSLDTGATRRLMQELELDSPAELLARLDAYHAVKKEHQAAKQALDQALADPELRRAEEELRGLTSRVEALEAEVLGAQGNPLSADTLEKRVSQLERELKAAGLEVPPRPALPARIIRTQDLKPVVKASGTGDLQLTTADLPDAPARAAPPRRASSVVEFELPDAAEALLRSPTLTGLPAWPPPGSESSSGDLPFQSGRYTPTPPAPSTLPSRAPSLVGQPVRPPPARANTIPPARAHTPLPPTPAPPPARASSLPRPAPAPAPRPTPSAPPAARALFDFGGGNIGGADDDEEEGYGGGYGPGGGGSDGEKQAPREDGYLMAGGFGPSGYGGAGGYGEDDGPAPDRSRDLVQAAVDLLQLDVDTLATSLSPRLSQYLAAFTEKKWRGASFGARGELSVFEANEGPKVAYVDLQGEELDLVDVALRFSLVEAILRKVRVPLLIDDPFAELPGKRRRLFTQMVGYLASATQVLAATELEDLSGNELKW
ncbi:MAG: hypothetical protein IPG45_01720 [Deltaproteobacteria bacterium]|nr:hypothetical protein [Deltaproteobacteria bacterium]